MNHPQTKVFDIFHTFNIYNMYFNTKISGDPIWNLSDILNNRIVGWYWYLLACWLKTLLFYTYFCILEIWLSFFLQKYRSKFGFKKTRYRFMPIRITNKNLTIYKEEEDWLSGCLKQWRNSTTNHGSATILRSWGRLIITIFSYNS